MSIKDKNQSISELDGTTSNFSTSRQAQLQGAGVMAAASDVGFPVRQASAANPKLYELGAIAAATAIRRGEITSEAYAATLIEQARDNADLNSFITIDEAAVLEAARAADLARAAGKSLPLLGVPIGVKDSFLTRDLKTTFGTSILNSYVPDRDAPVVESIRQAGAIVFGKNNLVEMSYGLTGNNPHHGQGINPYNKDHVTGGSSSGSGASVAARIVPVALGGDTVGSIRVPASLCGVVGFKPTQGRWLGDGVAPISHTLDTAGVLARNVEDCALIDSLVTKSSLPEPSLQPSLKGIRFAFAPKQHLAEVDSEVEKAFRETLRKLEDAGAQLIEIDLGNDFAALTARATWTVFARETRPAIIEFLKAEGIAVTFDQIYQDMGPDTRGVWANSVLPGSRAYSSDETYNNALNRDRPDLQSRYKTLVFNRADFILFPTTPCTAPPISSQRKFIVGGNEASYLILAKHTIPASSAGLPGISLPMGLAPNGLPLGIEIDAEAGRDSNLLAAARRVELVLGSLAPPARAA